MWSSDWGDVVRSCYRLRLSYVFDNPGEPYLEFQNLSNVLLWSNAAWLTAFHNHQKDVSVVAQNCAFLIFWRGSSVPEAEFYRYQNPWG